MKNNLLTTLSLFMVFVFTAGLQAENIKYGENWGKQGFNLVQSKTTNANVVFSVNEFNMDLMQINDENMHVLSMPGVMLPNEVGAPNLPGNGKFIAIPQGAKAVLEIVSMQTETYQNINVVPSHNIPFETSDDPLIYEKNPEIYNTNGYYPAEPVKLSEISQLRGVDFVILGITPFQYNPVTKELIVYKNIEVNVRFEGGTGQFGDNRVRSRWWDPILSDNLLNYNILPKIDYAKRFADNAANSDDDECEYIIISPDGADYQAWADSLRKFRSEQGILTKVFTLTEVGGNSTTAIEAFINNAYNSWSEPPAACLLLGDYGYSATNNILSPIHNNYCASDNIYADVTGNNLPEVVFARMTANNNDQLTTMVTKCLDYERTPPTSMSYYGKPITACGWQTERWFQICAESCGGFWNNELGKSTERINAIYSGTPGSTWSTAQNTSTVVNYFGPNGQGYIPATPNTLGGWTGGNSTMINNAIENGSFMMLHRDHGNTTLWGEPAYSTVNIGQLDNDELVFVFSINCLTGKYNMSGECFAEKFHRHTKNGHNAGAVGIIAASETSYSFVNDTYVWGMFDNMWPDFMPDYTTTPASRGVLPAFGNAAGKIHLAASSWPYNTGNKVVTYHLFHHHGDAFQVIHYDMPQDISMTHPSSFAPGTSSITMTATPGTLIGISMDGELIGSGTAAMGSVTIPLTTTLQVGDIVKIVGTNQNFKRYEALVPVEDMLVATFSADTTQVCTGGMVNFFDQSIGDPTEWEWTFEGGTPETSTVQYPTDIEYTAAGSFDVTLKVTNQYSTDTHTWENYINVYNEATPTIDIQADHAEICTGDQVMIIATCINQGENPLYEWYVNAMLIVDINDTIYLDNLADGDVIHCDMTSSRPCVTQPTVTSNDITMIVHDYVAVDVAINTPTTDVCEGNEVVFTATPSNPGANPIYTWYVNGNVAGDNSDTFTTTTITDQDVVSCELNSSEFCTTGNPAVSNNITMTVLPSEIVSVSIDATATTLCEGETVTFTATPVNPGATPMYEWKLNGNTVGTDSDTYTTDALLDQDVVICEMYADHDCSVPNPAASNAITMNIDMLPVQPDVPDGPSQVDTYVTLTSDYTVPVVAHADGYDWKVEPVGASSSILVQDNIVTVTWEQTFIGAATVNVYGTNACGNGPVSANFTVNVENSQSIIDLVNGVGIQVYPNPNNGNFSIELNSKTSININIKVINSIGDAVYAQESITVNGKFNKQINLSEFAEGVYFLMIESGGQVIQKPVVIQK